MDQEQPSQGGLGVLVGKRLDMAWQCALAAQRVKCLLGCIKKGGVLHPALGSSAQGRQPAGASPEEAKMIMRVGAPLL